MRLAASVVVVFSVIALVIGAAAATPAALADRGDLSGTVRDAGGSPLPGVTVTLTGSEHRTTRTDARGAFSFTGLLPGEYRLAFDRPGFARAVRPVRVAAGRVERLTVDLRPAAPPAAAETVGGVPGGVVGGVVGGLPDVRHEARASRAAHAHAPAPYLPGRHAGPFNTEGYDHLDENPFRRVVDDPLSTFSIDVDTASYANVRRFLNQGTLPPAGAVRIEELINYFRFDYPRPRGDAPFSITTEVSDCPWRPGHRLALVGLQAREIDEEDARPRNLVFLLDVSGSMASHDKLPLVRTAMRMLADVLTARDRVAIVVYAGASGLVLPPTPGDRKTAIHRAIAELEAGGSTNGASGITLAYQVAREAFIDGGVNRVILATDGDFNVGVTSQDALVRLIEAQRASGIFLSVLGVGTGNLKDSTLEKLADKGNGNYSYLDSLHEARKVLVREAGGTLVTVAKDVKIQVEFNPAAVAAYRLIGYENRVLRHEDFNDDRKDAGEIGAGHSVTALYEIVPAGAEPGGPGIDPLKYQQRPAQTAAAASGELLTVKLRYKEPDGDASRLTEVAVRNRVAPLGANLGFASAIAEFGLRLRGSAHAGDAGYAAAAARARRFRGADPEGYRAEFVKLTELAASLKNGEMGVRPPL